MLNNLWNCRSPPILLLGTEPEPLTSAMETESVLPAAVCALAVCICAELLEAAGVTDAMIPCTSVASTASQLSLLVYLNYCSLRLYQEQIKSDSPFLQKKKKGKWMALERRAHTRPSPAVGEAREGREPGRGPRHLHI